MRLVDNWRNAHKLFSVQVALFWGAVSGLYMALPAFQGFMSPFAFAGLCVGFALALVIARLTHQPGVS